MLSKVAKYCQKVKFQTPKKKWAAWDRLKFFFDDDFCSSRPVPNLVAVHLAGKIWERYPWDLFFSDFCSDFFSKNCLSRTLEILAPTVTYFKKNTFGATKALTLRSSIAFAFQLIALQKRYDSLSKKSTITRVLKGKTVPVLGYYGSVILVITTL